MSLLLDTNVIIGLVNGHPGIRRHAREATASAVFLSAIVAHELAYGAYKGTMTKLNLQRINALPFRQLAFEHSDALVAGNVRAALERRGTPIGNFDTLIAGQALARGLTLVTHNTREFSRVPGLRIEDWEA
ncbi:MAG: type II toxin-antitoxin system VapC family toxin [Candidatus Devosia phytovorans]|uniref:Ribonuclease VapC n=1 Tax=Candidatus Devosia phytovorans TaxID=3121372 RepID=A0AAJ6B269_9HYPH|nr:type II toxin-antitoxin system VapC family toxin [Devosia sp.]WEK05213.1 MAG: type II toxin-antitoxin system VapC family toxin [Devosia sp.]